MSTVSSRQEALAFARQVSIDPVHEAHLMWLAEVACCSPLSFPWVAVSSGAAGQADGCIYYHDQCSGVTAWEHPLAQYVLPIVEAARAWRGQHGELEAHMAALYTGHRRRLREDLKNWHGPYQSASGLYYYNSLSGVSSWEDPRNSERAQDILEFQQGLLHALQTRARVAPSTVSTVSSPRFGADSQQPEKAAAVGSEIFGNERNASKVLGSSEGNRSTKQEVSGRQGLGFSEDSRSTKQEVSERQVSERQVCDDESSLTYSSSCASTRASTPTDQGPATDTKLKQAALPVLKRSNSCAAPPVHKRDRDVVVMFPRFPVPPRPSKEELLPLPLIPPPLGPQSNFGDTHSHRLTRVSSEPLGLKPVAKTSPITLPAIGPSNSAGCGEKDPLAKLGSKHKKLGLSRPDLVMKAFRKVITVTSKEQDDV